MTNMNVRLIKQACLDDDFYIKKYETDDFNIKINALLPDVEVMVRFKTKKYANPFSPEVKILGTLEKVEENFTFDFTYNSFTNKEMKEIQVDIIKLQKIAEFICANWSEFVALSILG